MIRKFISSVMAGAFIGIGALTYLKVQPPILGALFFCIGILLVFNFFDMLLTRVCPLVTSDGCYHLGDVALAWFGNFIGAGLIALLGHFTRAEAEIAERVKAVAELKLNDSPLSLFIMGVFCAVFVTYAVLLGRRYKKGSFAQIFYIWFPITAFVLGGYEHIVANMYYLTAYFLRFGTGDMLAGVKVIFFVSLGNLAGGFFLGMLDRKFTISERFPGEKEPK